MDAPINPNVPRQASGTGFIVATVILLAVILVGAVFFWRARGDDAFQSNDAALEQVQTQSDSDTAASIEADLNATDVNNVDYDLDPANFTAS